jgi:hypothetical protein
VIAAALIIVTWLLAAHVDPTTQHICLSKNWNISIGSWGADARLHLFDKPMPYCGGIIYNAVPTPGAVPFDGRYVTGFDDRFGIYYRRVPCPMALGGGRFR